MHRRLLLVVALGAAFQPRAAAAQAATADPFAAVRDTIHAIMQAQNAPSFAVAVARGREILWEEGFGLADRERQVPATPHTMYSLASISKPFTATGIMLLAERGAVALDRPANEYLGAARLRAREGAAQDATIRRLLTHTAGLPLHYQFFYDGVARGHDNDEAIRKYGILVYPPGEMYSYSNLGYGILGHIIGRVSGDGYAAFMKAEVFEPLGLRNTGVGTGAGLRRAAVRYDNELKPLPPYGFDHDAASAVWSSAHDLVRFGMFHLGHTLEGQREILTRAARERMQQADAPADAPGLGRGLGWSIIEDDNGYRRVSHTGSMPGVSTVLNLIPSEGIVIVVLQNRNDAAAVARIANVIAATVLPRYVANREERRARARTGDAGVGADPDPPPAAMRGAWSGHVLALEDTIPLTLDVRSGGDVHVRLGRQAETLLANARIAADGLTGRFNAQLRPPDAAPPEARDRIAVTLTLRLRQDRLSGWAAAVSTAQPSYGAVSYGVELARAANRPSSRFDARIDSIFAAFAGDTTPGCAVAAARNGERMFAKGYGSASLEHHVPITARTRFYAASVSKQFTAYAVALLAEQRRLSLDDDIRRWIPEVPDFGTRITVRHLVHHTSGLRDYFGLLGLTGWPSDGPITEAQFLDLIGRQRALNFAPGTQHLYSNTGYVLLAILVERVTGERLRDFAEAQIFAPLGMHDTEFRDDHARLIPNRALAYSPQPENAWRLNVPGFDVIGDGGLFTTVEDLLRWDRHFLEPADRAATTAALLERGRLASGDTIAYAFGVTHGAYRGAPTIAHGGSYGGYRTYLLRFPEQRAAIATLCNTSTANPAALGLRVADVLLDDELARPVVAEASPAARPAVPPDTPAGAAPAQDPAALARYTGTYYSDELDTSWQLDVLDAHLVVRRRTGAHQQLEPRGTDTFSMRGGTLHFTRDGAGRITGFTFDAGRVTGLSFIRRGGL